MIELLEVAFNAMVNAYAPYSNYLVGAAVMNEERRIWTGCNVENVSYSLSICAERVAIAKMVADGCRDLVQLALVTADGNVPCGACSQVMLEFAVDPNEMIIYSSDSKRTKLTQYRLSDLIPHGFTKPTGSKS